MTIPPFLKTGKGLLLLAFICLNVGFFLGTLYGEEKAAKELDEMLYLNSDYDYDYGY